MATELDQWLRHSRGIVASLWADRISRWCLVTAVVSVWLGVAFVEPAFVPLLAGALVGIRLRRDARAAAAAELVDEDWL